MIPTIREEVARPRPFPGRLLSSAPATRVIGCEDWTQRAVFGFDSRDRRSRPFNLLRSQVLKTMSANGWRILGVTSATPDVGKSFVASNLAAALSRTAEFGTYLFDLDLRRGSVADVFGIEGDVGISQYLRGECDSLEGVASDVEGTRLKIYPTFIDGHSSAELLAGKRMTDLVSAMRMLPQDAMCLCDLPPVFANDDAVIVARQIDAYLLIVEEGVTTPKQIKNAQELLAPTPCVGTVLNRYRSGINSDDYGYGYRQSSKYDAYYG